MKVLLIGSGAVASVISKLLISDETITQITCGTNDLESAKEFIPTSDKLRLTEINASKKEDIEKIGEGVDIVINASLPDFNEVIMEAALSVGINYLDLCSHLKDGKTAEQLKFQKRFEDKKLRAIINAGISPGVTNLLVAEAADKLDEVEEVKIRTIEEQKASELIFSWSPKVLLDELTANPLVYRDGKFDFLKPFAETDEYEFPEPFSNRKVVTIYGDEVATIPFFIKLKNIDYKATGTDVDFGKALSRLGLFSNEPINIDGVKVIPLQFFQKIAPSVPTPKEMIRLLAEGVIEEAYFAALTDIVGLEDGKRVRIRNLAIFPEIKKVQEIFPGATYISYPTGLAAYAFLKSFDLIKDYGVFPPEALERHIRKKVLLELENQGIVIEEEFSTV